MALVRPISIGEPSQYRNRTKLQAIGSGRHTKYGGRAIDGEVCNNVRRLVSKYGDRNRVVALKSRESQWPDAEESLGTF